MTTIRRGRPRIGDAPAESIRLHARIPSRVLVQLEAEIGTDPESLRLALGIAVGVPKADRVLSYAPAGATERDTSHPISVVVPRDLAEQVKEIYGAGSPGMVRAFATAIVARRHQRGLNDGKGKLATKGGTE